jgi:hypothetical protein
MEMRRVRSIGALAAAVAIVLSSSGCLPASSPPVDIPLVPTTSTAPPASGSSTSQAGSGATSGENSTRVSAKSLAYAKNLGGWDHKGKDLYLIVGATYGSEAEAQAALDKALPLFGDQQSYFIVQHSDSFAGMAPGKWILVEAHFKTPSDDNMLFARRAFPDAQVVRGQVRVTDPIPVYEDMVGGD